MAGYNSSSSFPALGSQRPIKYITKQNHFITSDVFPKYFFLSVHTLRACLEFCQNSCQCVLSISSVLFY